MFLIPLNILELTTSQIFFETVWLPGGTTINFKKVAELENEKNFSKKKSFITPNFLCQIFFPTNHF